jgi:hypothetical protein
MLVSLLAGVCLPACSRTGLEAISQTNAPTSSAVPKLLPSPIPPEPLDPVTTASEPTAAAVTDIPVTGAWLTYQSQAGGYVVEYPAGWTVDEQAAADGSIVTTFSPADGSTGIMVLVQRGEAAGAGSSDLPNTRCQPATVGGLMGMRCFDTLNFATSTTVSADGQTFTIAALGKRVDESLYNLFLETFRIT